MTNFIGLYYPYIHFKDETWLKTVALYCERVKRIVPYGYELKDSELVKTLAGETDMIENIRPSPGGSLVEPFVRFLTSNAAELRMRYGIKSRDKWKHDPITLKWAPLGSDTRLAYVHIDKVAPRLKNALLETGLAEAGTRDNRWVGMHPKVADVYMMVLAEDMATKRGWSPITDEAFDQLAVSGFSIERLSRALLQDKRLADDKPMAKEMRAALANLCLEAVIPKNVQGVPIEKIIKLRTEHRAEFDTFQTYLAAFRAHAADLTAVTDQVAFAEHLQLYYKKTMKPSIDEVRKAFKLMKMPTATSILNVNLALPALAAGAVKALGLAIDPVAAGVAGFALGVVPIIQKRREEAQAAVETPGAWLLRVEEGLTPQDFMSRVRQSARKFALGV